MLWRAPESRIFMAALKLTLACLVFTGTASAVDVVTEANAHAAVRFGASEVKMALERKGINSGRILIGTQGDAIFSTVSAPRPKPPAAAEAYCITISGDTVAVEGSDHIGATYGALDPAEQINGASGSDWLRQLRGGSHSPYLEVRGINILLTAQGFDDPDSWYWSDSYWQRFLDMLVRNRYNFLDVEGTYDLTATDESGIERVRVYYKRMPSTAEWLSLDMIKTAADTYAGNVPVDPEGILYYLEVVDRDGNAANYPNFLRQTPYFVVNGRQAK